MSKRKHYVVGAGMVGCLYDYGPRCHDTKRSAMSDAEWYLDGAGEGLTKADVRRMRSDLHNHGIHYFPSKIRHVVGADYIEINEQPGPCPE